MTTQARLARGQAAFRGGIAAEQRAAEYLAQEGWTILAKRLRTPHGELDLVAADHTTLLIVEVKRRARLSDAAYALAPKQSARLLAATEYLLATKPEWVREGVRIDVMIFDAIFRARRIKDALRSV